MPFDTQLEPMQARVTQLLEPARVLEWLRAQDSERQLSPYNYGPIAPLCIVGTYLKEATGLNAHWGVERGIVEDVHCYGTEPITRFLTNTILRDPDSNIDFALPASELADILESHIPAEEPANG